MGMKKYLRRVGRYILHGVPNVSIKAKIGFLKNGSQLADRRILITGGSTGIGAAIAKKVISEGAQVVITGRDDERLSAVATDLGTSCKWIAFDNENTENVESLLNEAIDKLGFIDSIVCNAGISLHEASILQVSQTNFVKQFRINLESNFFLAQAFIKYRLQNSNSYPLANILFISSERGSQADDLPYGLTKVALNSLTSGISKRFAKDGIKVNAIAPGVTATRMTGRSEDGNLFENGQSSKRYFLPTEVAEVSAFMLSDASNCISGEIINCDAGQHNSSYLQ